MLITFTHAYIPCWLANAIELCTKQTHNRVCVTHPLPVYKEQLDVPSFLPTKMLVRTRFVQFTYFMRRVHCSGALCFCSSALCKIYIVLIEVPFTAGKLHNRVCVTHPFIFANQNVSAHALCAIYIFHEKGTLLWCPVLLL